MRISGFTKRIPKFLFMINFEKIGISETAFNVL